MKKQLLTLAAAAALACSSLTFAADETNRAGRTAGEVPGAPQGGQTGTAKPANTSEGSNGAAVTGGSSVTGTNGTSSSTGMNATGSSSATGSGSVTSPGGVTASGTTTGGSISGTNSGSPLNPAGANGAAMGDMAQAGSSATSDAEIQQAISSANDADKLFLVCAAIDNNAEIQLAQLAEKKAQDPQVKQIAQRIIQDHQQAQRQLKEAAQQTGVQIPSGVTALKQQEMRVMQALNGKDFDQQYISMMRAGHAKAVSEYTDVAQTAKNDQVKAYASQTLPALQQHYQHVQRAATALGLPNMSEAQPAGAHMQGTMQH